MTEGPQSAAYDTAMEYHRAWTSGDIDGAMMNVAEDIVCRAPGGDISGKAAYRAFIGDFAATVTGLSDFAAFGDEEHVVLVYCPHTTVTTTAPAAEHFVVRGGLIVHSTLVFDRLSFTPPQAA